MADLQVVKTSKQFTLQLNDFWKGLIVATLTTPITALYTSISAGSFTIDWKAEELLAAAGFLSYIIKNFFTPTQTVITGTPTPGAITTVTIPAKEVGVEVKPTIRETPTK